MTFVALLLVAGTIAHATGLRDYFKYHLSSSSDDIDDAMLADLATYYRIHGNVRLGPEHRLPDGVAWRLLIDRRTGAAVPRLTWMREQRSLLKANALFDALHGEALAGYDVEDLERRRQELYAWHNGRPPDMTKPPYSLPEYVAVTYATSRLVSYVEVRRRFVGAEDVDFRGRVLDLERGRIREIEGCVRSDVPQADMWRDFTFGDWLEVCGDAAYDRFKALWLDKLRQAVTTARARGANLSEEVAEIPEEGDPLYQIDPKPFEVELQASEAALARAKANLDLSLQQAARSAGMVKAQAIAAAQHEIALSTVAQNKAEVAAREADVARARLNLDYATVRAPISGRIGAARTTEGALVVQNDTVNLATIQQLDTIYADFTQSVAELNRLRRAFESGDLERLSPDAVKVRLVLDDGSTYAHAGKLLFSEARVDASSGQVTLRGEFPNPNRELLPGMYVRVLIDQGVDSDAITVPEQSVQRNGGGGSEVFVVKDDNRVALQPVRLGAAQDGRWLVVEGLKPGDRVVVDGFQKFAAGDSVKPRSVVQSAQVMR